MSSTTAASRVVNIIKISKKEGMNSLEGNKIVILFHRYRVFFLLINEIITKYAQVLFEIIGNVNLIKK